jgi:hypothetical protein
MVNLGLKIVFGTQSPLLHRLISRGLLVLTWKIEGSPFYVFQTLPQKGQFNFAQLGLVFFAPTR